MANIEAEAARQRAVEQVKQAKTDAEEAEWRRGVARKLQHSKDLEEVLPRRADLMRYWHGPQG